jgi:MFS family permease
VKQLVAALAGVSVFGLSFGLLYPLMALQLESKGYSSTYIGVVAAMQPMGLVLSNFLLPSIAARVGVGTLLKFCVVAISIVFAAYPFLPPTPFWFVLRFIHGALASSLYVISEAIIIRLSIGDSSTRVLSIYTAAMQTTFGVGPLILLAVGVQGSTAFLIGAGLTLLGGLIMILGGASKVELYDDSERKPFFSVLWQLKILLVSFAVFAFSDAATADLLPVYGKKLEFSTSAAAMMLAAFLFGSTILQIPLSYLFSKAKDAIQLPVNVGAIALSFLALVAFWDTYLVWPIMAVAGALTSSINTIALTQLGKRLVGSDLISGTASLTTVWGLTALIATPIAGVGMDLAGPQALPYSIVLFSALSIVISLSLALLKKSSGQEATELTKTGNGTAN